MSSSTNNASTVSAAAAARYPLPSQIQLREDYIYRLTQCRVAPAYHVLMPNGLEPSPCRCEPFMEDDTKGWTTIKRKIRVKKIKSDEQLDYEAAQMHDYWETASADSWTMALPVTAPTGEYNGALFDIGSRF